VTVDDRHIVPDRLAAIDRLVRLREPADDIPRGDGNERDDVT